MQWWTYRLVAMSLAMWGHVTQTQQWGDVIILSLRSAKENCVMVDFCNLWLLFIVSIKSSWAQICCIYPAISPGGVGGRQHIKSNSKIACVSISTELECIWVGLLPSMGLLPDKNGTVKPHWYGQLQFVQIMSFPDYQIRLFTKLYLIP